MHENKIVYNCHQVPRAPLSHTFPDSLLLTEYERNHTPYTFHARASRNTQTHTHIRAVRHEGPLIPRVLPRARHRTSRAARLERPAPGARPSPAVKCDETRNTAGRYDSCHARPGAIWHPQHAPARTSADGDRSSRGGIPPAAAIATLLATLTLRLRSAPAALFCTSEDSEASSATSGGIAPTDSVAIESKAPVASSCTRTGDANIGEISQEYLKAALFATFELRLSILSSSRDSNLTR